jgi:hypothetical protein
MYSTVCRLVRACVRAGRGLSAGRDIASADRHRLEVLVLFMMCWGRKGFGTIDADEDFIRAARCKLRIEQGGGGIVVVVSRTIIGMGDGGRT